MAAGMRGREPSRGLGSEEFGDCGYIVVNFNLKKRFVVLTHVCFSPAT